MAVGGPGLTLAACGSSGDGRSDEAATTAQAADPAVVPADLDGSTFTSTEVVGHDLVPGTEVTLEFDQGTMSVAAGCNTQFGAYELDGDVLRWAADPASSMVGCEPALAQQDAWLADFFTAGARVTPDDRGLTLTADGVTLAMVGEGEADLAALLGTSWDLVGTVATRDGPGSGSRETPSSSGPPR